MNNTFKKQDLKAGMLIQYRNGDFRLVIQYGEKDELYLIGSYGDYAQLTNFNNDLTGTYKDIDILKVYSQSNKIQDYMIFNTVDRQLLWERKEEDDKRKEDIKKKNEMLEQREELIKEIEDKFNQLNVLNDNYLQFMDEHFKWDSEYYLPSDKYFRKTFDDVIRLMIYGY